MKTAIVTDGKYRSSIAAVRALHRAGYQVIVTQTRADVHAVPAVASRALIRRLTSAVSISRWSTGSRKYACHESSAALAPDASAAT